MKLTECQKESMTLLEIHRRLKIIFSVFKKRSMKYTPHLDNCDYIDSIESFIDKLNKGFTSRYALLTYVKKHLLPTKACSC